MGIDSLQSAGLGLASRRYCNSRPSLPHRELRPAVRVQFRPQQYYAQNAGRNQRVLLITAGLGLEPRLTPPEGAVLPLYDPAMS